MKTFISFFLFIFFYISVNAQCNLKTEKDQFTGTIKKSTDYELVSITTDGILRFQIIEFTTSEDTFLAIFIRLKVQFGITCFGHDSQISFKSGEIIRTINLSGEIKCKSAGEFLNENAILSKEDFDFLKSNYIEVVRIYFDKGSGDFNLRAKSDYFIRTLKCFE